MRHFPPPLLAAAGFCILVCGTGGPVASGQPHSDKQSEVPLTMHECEGATNCGTWTFLGTEGSGHWPSGEAATLTIESWDTDTITIHRSDSAGPSAGLTAVYHGSRHGNRIEGQFRAVVPGKSTAMGMWEATLVRPATADEGARQSPNGVGVAPVVCVPWFRTVVCLR
jgi:hypothetical protein